MIKKISNDFTNKFCNSIGFGLSKESAFVFAIKENNQTFKKKKDIEKIDNDLLADEIAESVIDKCGYPLEMYGEEGMKQFKKYYISEKNNILKIS